MTRMLVAIGLVALASCGDDPEPNRAPTVDALALSTAEDTPLPFRIVAFDADRDLLQVSLSAPGHGTVAGSNGDYVYTPGADFNGVEMLTATVSDGEATATAAVTITVTPVNDGPVAVGESFATGEDIALVTAQSTLLRNDTDLEADTLTVVGVGVPVHGTVAIVGSDVTFSPDVDYSGDGSYQYTISDGRLTAVATVTIQIGSGNDPPVAIDDAATTAEDTTLMLAVATLVGNDTDIENNTLAITAVGGGVRGTVALAGETISFTPEPDFHGSGRFEYTVSDGAATDTGVVTVTIAAVNDPPLAVSDELTTAEDTALTVAVAELLANDSDVDGDALSVTAVGAPISGTVALSGGQVLFTPGADVTGTAGFSYTVSDGTTTRDGTVVVRVTSVNDAPEASDDTLTTVEDTVVVVTGAELVADDVDIDSATLTVVSVGSEVGGDAILSAGTIGFMPAPNFTGTGSFIYTVSDGTLTDTATVTVTVTPVNDPPVAGNDTAATSEDTAVAIPVGELLANDADIDGGPLVVTDVSSPSRGTVVLAAGVVTYTPPANASGTATFVYVVSDGAATDTGTVTVTIAAVNDPPVAVADADATSEDTAVVITVASLLDNDIDVDDTALTMTAVGAATGGVVVRSGATLTFTPSRDFHGAATFEYTVSDGDDSDDGLVTVTVAPVNDPPVATDDDIAASEDAARVIAATELTANDDDVDGDVLTITAVSAASNGQVALAGTTVTFTPDDNYHGDAGFSYTVSDGTVTRTATVAIEVASVNDAPAATPRMAATAENRPVSITLVGIDVDDDELTFDIVDPPDHGELAGSGATRMYSPELGFDGTDTFTYTVSDGALTSAPATVTIEVANIPLCGDGDVEGDEPCDDGNQDAQDGCTPACVQEICGDGAVQFGLGEQCDDGNRDAGDGCSDLCQLDVAFATTEPVLVSGGLSCGLESSHTGRKVAIDGVGTIYALLRCDGAAQVAVSTDRGVTFAAPVPVAMTGVGELAIAAGAGGLAYVVARIGTGVVLARTEDAGLTWTEPVEIATSNDSELSVEAWASDVFVGVGVPGGIRVLRNRQRGTGGFDSTTLTIAQVFFDLLLDDRTGDLLVCSDSPVFRIRRSTDGGASFAPEINPTGGQAFSDWAAGNGQLLVAGSGLDLIRLTRDDLATSSVITGLPRAASSQRAVSVDAEGNAYIVGRGIDGTIQLRRLLTGADAIDGERTLTDAGSYPALTALPTGDGAVVLYMVDDQVMATVQVY